MSNPIILDGKRCADEIAEVLKERVDNLKANCNQFVTICNHIVT